MLIDIAIPILPSRNLTQSAHFYAALGFTVMLDPTTQEYLLCRLDERIELHFFHHAKLDLPHNDHGCYLRVADAQALFERWQPVAPPNSRLTSPQPKPWGMFEGHLFDPDNNLIRFGQITG